MPIRKLADQIESSKLWAASNHPLREKATDSLTFQIVR